MIGLVMVLKKCGRLLRSLIRIGFMFRLILSMIIIVLIEFVNRLLVKVLDL